MNHLDRAVIGAWELQMQVANALPQERLYEAKREVW